MNKATIKREKQYWKSRADKSGNIKMEVSDWIRYGFELFGKDSMEIINRMFAGEITVDECIKSIHEKENEK